jgi:integrase
MSVFLKKDRRHFTYEFWYRGLPYRGSTGKRTRDEALAVERAEKTRVERMVAGVTDLRDAPRFQTWAGVYYEVKAHGKHKVKRPDQIDWQLRTLLKFWGARPRDPQKVDPHAPYHDLTLADPITEPEWLDRFETWLAAQGFSGSHCNHQRTQVSGLYRVAMLPRYRKLTGITTNPMVGVPRDRRKTRDVELSPEQLRAWMAHASYHVRLAMGIAALAPKLRLGNVLALEWEVNLDRRLTRIRVDDHKTDADGKPIIELVGDDLRTILHDARRRNPGRWVVAYRGKRVKDIRAGVQAAAERAGLRYGIGGGVTFHAIRHAVSTWFAEMDEITEPLRAALVGHADIRTTQDYTHLRPVREQKPLAKLAAQLDLTAVVTHPGRRWTNRAVVPFAGPDRQDKELVTAAGKPAGPPRPDPPET